MGWPSLTTLSFDLEVLAAVFVPVGALALVALSSRNDDFRRAALRWFIPLVLLWFAPCWLAGRSPVAFDLLEGWLRPWKGPAPFVMTGNGLLADVPLQFVPWRELVTESWLSGELPSLNRYAGAGSPLWANPSAGVLASATILGVAFSSFAWPLFAAVLRLLTALCGMYLFMRAEKVSHSGALVSAIAWGFGASIVAFALFPQANVMPLLPFLLLAISGAVERDGPRGVAWASLVLALMLLGGHAETVLHCAVAAIPWAIRAVVLRTEGRARAAARCLALGVLGLMLAAPAIVPFAFQLPYSERLTRLETETSLAAAPRLNVDNVIPFVLPAHYFHSKDAAWDGDNFNEAATQYVGLLALALAITAIYVVPERVRFWAILAAACMPLAFEWAGTSMLGDWFPWFDKVLHGRLRFVIAFALAAAAGHGFDAVAAKAKGAVRTMTIATALAIVALALALLTNWELYATHDTLARVLVAGVAAAVTAAVAAVALSRGGAAAAIVPLLLAVDLCASLVDYNAAVGRERFYPDRPSLRALADGGRATRVLALGGGLMPNSGAMYRLEQTGVNDPMAYEPFLALLRSGGYDMRHYFNRFDTLPPRILLDYLGVTRILVAPGARVEGLPDAYRGPDAAVVVNPRALARYFIPTRVVATPRPLEMFKRGNDATVVWVEKESGAFIPGGATLALSDYGANGATIDVDATSASFVASSEVAMPGWRLERNGVPWPIERVNGMFVAWPVPPGPSRFVLSHRPPGLREGNALALLAIACFLGWAFLERRHPRAQA